MRKTVRWIVLVLPWALACAPGEDPQAGDPPGEPVVTGGPQNAGMGTMAAPIAMRPIGESGVTGQATITPRGTGMEITVQLWGMSVGSHPGHVRHGTCTNMGSVVQDLPEVVIMQDGAGTVEAVLEQDSGVLLAGTHLIAYHDRASGAPVVCGELTPHST